jgi:hypothetical protein
MSKYFFSVQFLDFNINLIKLINCEEKMGNPIFAGGCNNYAFTSYGQYEVGRCKGWDGVDWKKKSYSEWNGDDTGIICKIGFKAENCGPNGCVCTKTNCDELLKNQINKYKNLTIIGGIIVIFIVIFIVKLIFCRCKR